MGRDEQGVGGVDQRRRRAVQPLQRFHRARPCVGRVAHPLDLAALDVLRAVADRLPHAQPQPVRAGRLQLAVDPVAPPRVQLDAQQAERSAGRHAGRGRVAGAGRGGKGEMPGIGRLHKAWRPHQHRGPGPAGGVDAAGQHQRQLLVEALVLLGHVVAHDARADLGHALRHAETGLHGDLASVEGLSVHGDPPQATARRPAGVAWNGTKPGSASMRDSQPRSAG
jgi:hypothetical protein